jgi:type VI secretion system protein ImpM
MSPVPSDARVGLYGKLPSRGDFIRENLPRDFVEGWDAWWQRGLADTQARGQDEWREAWLEAPVWRFVLPPGCCGASGVLGLWMPSVDRAGRFFPLTFAAVAAADWVPYVGSLMRFLEEAEEAGRDALEQDLAPIDLLGRIQAAFMAGDVPDGVPELAVGQAAWWTDGGPRVAARVETAPALPEGDRFAALIDDGWNPAQPALEATTEAEAEPS